MYRFEVTEESQIIDFESRYSKINEDIKTLEEHLDETKEEYTKLKKLSYNAKLAENVQYCYGPLYINKISQEQHINQEFQDEKDKENHNVDSISNRNND